MIRRLRSSSRWPTSVSRSSWPTGRRAVAMLLSCGYPAGSGSGLGLRGALVSHGVGRRGRPHDLTLTVVVVLMVVITVLAGDGVLELAHPRAELPPERRKALGTEDDQHDDEHDHEFEWADAARHAASSGSGGEQATWTCFAETAVSGHWTFKFLRAPSDEMAVGTLPPQP